jgi:DNA-binding MarR family transcriptional regulator
MFEATTSQPALFGALAAERLEARIERRMDILDFLKRNPGATAGEIARGVGCDQQAVSAHLHRGQGRVFATTRGRWFPIPN